MSAPQSLCLLYMVGLWYNDTTDCLFIESVNFKLAALVLVYKCLTRRPSVIIHLWGLSASGISFRRHLRSAKVQDTCLVPRTQTRLGDRSFTVAGRSTDCNSLPMQTLDLCRFDTDVTKSNRPVENSFVYSCWIDGALVTVFWVV